MEDITKNTIDAFNRNAELYQNQFMNVDLYADTLDMFCEQVSKINAEILEVGCGPANITKYLIDKRPDYKILATDLSERMLELAQKNISNVEFKALDFKNLKTINKKYDGIVSGFCLPYLSKNEFEQFLENASRILKENGFLYLSTMEDDNEKSEFKKSSTRNGKPIFINYYTADYVTNILKNNSFKKIIQKRKVSKDKKGNEVTDLIIIAKKTLHSRVGKGEFHP